MLSWDVCGLNSPAKRCSVFHQTSKADSIFLQEPRLKIEDQKRLHKPRISQIFHSKLYIKVRDVAILINNRITFIVSDIKSDVNKKNASL